MQQNDLQPAQIKHSQFQHSLHFLTTHQDFYKKHRQIKHLRAVGLQHCLFFDTFKHEIIEVSPCLFILLDNWSGINSDKDKA